MIKPDYPRIEIDDLASIIRESITASKSNDEQSQADNLSAEHKSQYFPELKLQPDFEPRADDRYHVNDLLQYHDRAFLYAAYRAILKRSPDEAEYLRDRKQLQSGHFNKIDLLAALRFSPEGKAKKVQLDGLTIPALIRRLGRLPLVGYPITLAIAFLRLPNLVREQRQLSAYLLAQNQHMADFANAISASVSEFQNGISRLEESLAKQLSEEQLRQQTESTQRLRELDQQLTKRIDVSKEIFIARLETEVEHRLELRQSLTEQLTTIQSKVDRLRSDLQSARTELTLRERSFDILGERSKDISVSPELASLKPHQLDAFYASLEDRFRGTREEIKERFRLYLPYVRESAPVIDLGCGRGEWLEILNEEGINARGVDKNLIQIQQCQDRGLKVDQSDFFAYLSSLADASVGAVTGFHIVEHVSIENLIKLVTEVMRVLRPGGVAIFETPNPDNVLVGSNFFYMDPTHRHPLPSQLMEFILQNRGFDRIKVLNLHPWDAGKVAGETELAHRFNAYFYGPMDYAILGWKVGP